jgi:hypothetical protein
MVQIMGQSGAIRQGKQSMNVKQSFCDAFNSMDTAADHHLVRVEVLSSFSKEALPYTVECLHTLIENEVSDLAELAGVSIRAIRFFVAKEEGRSLAQRASGNAFVMMREAMRTGSGRKVLSTDMVRSWLNPEANKGQVWLSQLSIVAAQ